MGCRVLLFFSIYSKHELYMNYKYYISPIFGDFDSYGIMWHGNYLRYFEEAREKFSEEYGIGLKTFLDNELLLPIIKMNIDYIQPLKYGEKYFIEIDYMKTTKPIIRFEYKIFDLQLSLYCRAYSHQVFYSKKKGLILKRPEFLIKLENDKSNKV